MPRNPAEKPANSIHHRVSKNKPKGAKAGAGRSRRLSAKDISAIFAAFARENPEPKGELEHTNPYTLLVAVVLSAQATDAGVNKATRNLFRLADTPAKMIALGEDKVRDLIRTIGLYRNKAKNIIALSEKLLAEHGGRVPNDREALESLPGVGRKTANVVMNVAFGQPTMAVDTHVFRVANRIGLSDGKTPLAVEEDLLRIIPRQYALHAHHWLILHGRYLCKARVPECWRCPILSFCRFEPKSEFKAKPVQAAGAG
ncbi:MAG: endonuclease III [Hyphomicrobium sp.]|jgi:endonuclease-3|nr:endonuclease III [Hyphomicrobium sp.]